MAREKHKKQETEDVEKTIDPYTGELVPVPEDADQFIEVVPEETDDRHGQNYLLNEETSLDSYAADADADAVEEQSAHYTEDEDIKEDFAERQGLAATGRDELLEELEEHHALSPEISGGDLDAAWQDGNVAGEETVGGSVPTPDQDIVDELGKAAGLNYKNDEPLNYDAKVLDRDRHRWELNPASAQDDEEEEEDEEEDLDDLTDEEDLELLDADEDEEFEEDGDDELNDEDDELVDDESEDEEDDDI
jgi:hypothetical protein